MLVSRWEFFAVGGRTDQRWKLELPTVSPLSKLFSSREGEDHEFGAFFEIGLLFQTEIEGPRDAVAGEIFESGIDDHCVVFGGKALLRRGEEALDGKPFPSFQDGADFDFRFTPGASVVWDGTRGSCG